MSSCGRGTEEIVLIKEEIGEKKEKSIGREIVPLFLRFGHANEGVVVRYI